MYHPTPMNEDAITIASENWVEDMSIRTLTLILSNAIHKTQEEIFSACIEELCGGCEAVEDEYGRWWDIWDDGDGVCEPEKEICPAQPLHQLRKRMLEGDHSDK